MMRSPSGALLDRFDTATIADNPEVWSRAYRQLQAGTMPPVGAPRPGSRRPTRCSRRSKTALGAERRRRQTPPTSRLPTVWPDCCGTVRPTPTLCRCATQSADVRRRRSTSRSSACSRTNAPTPSCRAFSSRGSASINSAKPNRSEVFPRLRRVTLRDAMATETDLFLRSQLRDNRDPISLWDADYTFLNEPLARHYGIPGITGGQFRRVALSTPERAGLLGQGSILMVTSRHQPGQTTRTPLRRRAPSGCACTFSARPRRDPFRARSR